MARWRRGGNLLVHSRKSWRRLPIPNRSCWLGFVGKDVFQTPLPFAGNGIQKLRFKGGREESFNATYLNTGTLPVGSTWAMNPIPMCCPDNAPCTITNVHTCSSVAHSTVPVFPFPTKSGNGAVRDFSIVDTVRIPEGVSPGKYVLQWRWDAEQTSQVWGACSDVTIVP